jgi:hypothetical protein
MVFGKLYVQGGIDPTYLAIEPLVTDPIPAGLQGIWVDDSQNALHVKSNKITLNDATNTTQLSETGLSDIYAVGPVENKEQISVSSVGVVDTISATDASTYQNSIITTCNTTNTSTIFNATIPSLPQSTTGGATINCNSSLAVMGVGCSIDGFPGSTSGSATLQADISNPLFSISQSAPFAPSYSTIINKDGIIQNNSGGSGFTINSNAENCNIISGAVASMIGGTGGNASISCSTGAIIASADAQVFASGLAGSVATPNFTMRNSNVGSATYPALKLDKSGVDATAGNTIGTISSWAVDATGTSREWSRIQTVATNVGAGNQDGTISIFGTVNGTMAEVFNFNGSQNENNSFKPLDMNNQQIRSNTGDLVLSTTASTGTGDIFLNPKTAANVIVSDANITIPNSANGVRLGTAPLTTNYNVNNITMTNATENKTIVINNSLSGGDGVIGIYNTDVTANQESSINNSSALQELTLSNTQLPSGNTKTIQIENYSSGGASQIVHTNFIDTFPLLIEGTQTGVAINAPSSTAGRGDIAFSPNTTNGNLVFAGTNLERASQSGTAAGFLRIKLNDVFYRLQLLVDAD